MLGHFLLLLLFSMSQNLGPLYADYEGLCREAVFGFSLGEEAHLPVKWFLLVLESVVFERHWLH